MIKVGKERLIVCFSVFSIEDPLLSLLLNNVSSYPGVFKYKEAALSCCHPQPHCLLLLFCTVRIQLHSVGAMAELESNTCFICQEKCSICDFCGLVSVCDEHKTVHRPDNYCYPFTIQHSTLAGHYMVAVRDIKQKEIILREWPVVVGPYTKADVVHCVECFKKVDDSVCYQCHKCGYPFCQETCREGSANHEVECNLFTRAGWKYQGNGCDFAAITVIRLLHLKQKSPDIYRRLIMLEDHNEYRKKEDKDLWEYHSLYVINFICNQLEVDIEVKEVWAVLGKMFTNCGDLELTNSYARGCGYYPSYANMNHACRANTKTFKYPDQRLEVRAQVAIARGQEISTQYVQSMKATFSRRPVLKTKWFFDCLCDRCLDPTECGSYMSSLLCTRPAPVAARPCGGSVLSQEPTSGEADWLCQACGLAYTSQYVLDIINDITNDLDTDLETDTDSVHHFERILHKYSTILHPNHYILIDTKMKLAQIYGNFAPYKMLTLPRHMMERKIQVKLFIMQRHKKCFSLQVCQDLLDVISKVDPGFTKTRGIMLSEMNKTKLLIAKQNLLTPANIKDKVFQKYWEKACLEKQFLNMYIAYYQSLFHNSK